MYVQDLRNSKTEFSFDSFEKGALLIRKSDPNEFFMKIDETDEGNAVYVDNGEVFRVQSQEPCSPVKYTFTIES
jgi:hypothetical protein